jgi:hypothetical protein
VLFFISFYHKDHNLALKQIRRRRFIELKRLT